MNISDQSIKFFSNGLKRPPVSTYFVCVTHRRRGSSLHGGRRWPSETNDGRTLHKRQGAGGKQHHAFTSICFLSIGQQQRNSWERICRIIHTAHPLICVGITQQLLSRYKFPTNSSQNLRHSSNF